MGIGIGAKNATVPIYSSEMAPHRVRGALVMFWQLWVVAGIFLGFCANVIVKDTGKTNSSALYSRYHHQLLKCL
jgi:MFS family permease